MRRILAAFRGFLSRLYPARLIRGLWALDRGLGRIGRSLWAGILGFLRLTRLSKLAAIGRLGPLVRLRKLVAPAVPFAVSAILAAAVVGLMFWSDALHGINFTLQQMGFDPGRAQLIEALLAGGIAAAAVVLQSGRIGRASFLGGVLALALFVQTFVSQTQAALAATGGEGGYFYLPGWVFTVVTVLGGVLVAAWIGAMLASGVRPRLAQAVGVANDVVHGRKVERGAIRRAGAVALVAVLLVGFSPVFSDMVNYTTDTWMLRGQPQIGLVNPGGGANFSLPAIPSIEATPSPTAAPSEVPSAGASATPVPSPTPTPDPHPWLAWVPQGVGSVKGFQLKAPWTGGSEMAYVAVYTPAGYNTKGNTRHYPVIYEAPYTWARWDDAAGIQASMNTLIANGTVPPVIVVSVSYDGGPFAVDACVDSYDGKEWFDSWVANTVVPWVDSNYRTIQNRLARAVEGASTGGYCAAVLVAHHPDIFGTSLDFSGYFIAAYDGSSGAVYGNDWGCLTKNSPDYDVAWIDPSLRANTYWVLIAQKDQPLYWDQAVYMDQILTAFGYPHTLYVSPWPHGWVQWRNELGTVMAMWGAKMSEWGVFRPKTAGGDGSNGTA